MFTHVCVKPGCGASYKTKDPDPYYCEDCLREKNALAKRIDAQVAARPKRNRTSALADYDNSPKVHGFVQVRL